MAGMTVDGLASGLNTSELISQLMQVEATTQTQLKSRVAAANKVITALQGVNTRAAALVTSANTLADDKTWSALQATSSDSSISVATATGAVPSSARIDVLSTAKNHSVATSAIVWPPVDGSTPPPGPHVVIRRGDETLVDLTAASADPAAVAAAINEKKAGVSAVALQVEPGKYRIQITSADSGEAGRFTVEDLGSDTSVVRDGEDAVVSLGAGLTVRSSTNTFKDVLPGTTFTVSKENVTGALLSVQQDNQSVTKAVADMVGTVNILLSDIKSQSRAPAAAGDTAGVLLGNSAVRNLTQSLLSAASGSLGSDTVAATGVQITRDGMVTFDEKAFSKLLTEDPEKAKSLATALARQVSAVADAASNATTGSLTQLVSSRQGTVKDLNAQVESWDTRLATRETALRRQFSALEVALSNMRSQSTWLSGQLAGLSSAG